MNEQIEQKTVIFTANDLEASAGLIKLVDYLHTHAVTHSLLATYYKPTGQQKRQKVLIMITKDTDILFDKTC